jgi:peptidoglycan/LPS O-acetylase OafA/YrhL
MRRIADFAQGRDNNFNLLRLMAASMVIYAHAHTVAQGFVAGVPNWSGDVLFDLTGMDSGRIAVQVFFVMSGFLVAQSLTRSGSVAEFLYARFLRIMPALGAAILFSVFVIGLYFTTRRNDPQGQFLPGVFEGNVYGRVINGSLWTLPWEAKMYLSLAVLFLLGLLQHRRAMASIFVVMLIVFCFTREGRLHQITYLPLTVAFASFFYSGVLAFLYRDRIPMGRAPLLISAALLVASLFLFKASVIVRCAYPILLAYTALAFALVPGGSIRAFNRLGDYSYGVYVYGFPVEQALMALNPAFTPMQVCGLGLGAALLLAVPSWHLLEKPMLARKLKRREKPAVGDRIDLEPATLRTQSHSL